KRKHGLPPRPGLAFDRRQGRATLAAEGKKHHERQRDRWRVDWAAIRPALGLHRLAQFHVTYILRTAKIVNGPERSDDDLTRREAGQGSHTDLPVPAQWADNGLDHPSGLPQKTLSEPGAGFFTVEAGALLSRGRCAAGAKLLGDAPLIGVVRQRPDQHGGGENNGPSPSEERPTAVIHAEQHDPPGWHLERRQFQEERHRLTAQDRAFQSPSDRRCDDQADQRSEEHTSELQSRGHLVFRLLLEKKQKPSDEPSDDQVLVVA